MTALEALLTDPNFAQSQRAKESALMPLFQELITHYRTACPAYRRIMDVAFPDPTRATALSDLPYLPISLFKDRSMQCGAVGTPIAIQSSGTGGIKSQIRMDAVDARRAAKALSGTLRTILGPARLPMLIIDAPSSIQGGVNLGARAAAILGIMPYGRDPCFVLDDDLRLDVSRLRAFLDQYGAAPFIIYGFTFLVWQALAEVHDIDLSHGTLLHSGGWKKLEHLGISNADFKTHLYKNTGLTNIRNFYGMAELPGTVFMENENGLFYAPPWADIVIRDPVTLAPLPTGQDGLVQVMHVLPHSYPGGILLTEDIGRIETVDAGGAGWMGAGLRLLGRAPKVAMRGCSDVLAERAGGL